mgnify:FL=1
MEHTKKYTTESDENALSKNTDTSLPINTNEIIVLKIKKLGIIYNFI